MPTLEKSKKKIKTASPVFIPYTPLDFVEINRQANHLADIIESRFKALADILLEYESYEVVKDEVARTLDLLRSLDENKEYFKLRINAVTAFLPRNQPLYAFACFVVVPSFMASEVCFRIPSSMKGFFRKMLTLLDINELFPNIVIFGRPRNDFLLERTALLVNPKTKASIPTNDAVIFTGTSFHANQLRMVFDKKTLFIANGSGHNPIVVSEDANLNKAVDAVLTLQFYNQGQDCAAPNAVLVHKNILPKFRTLLHKKISTIKLGEYRNKSCRIGPISDPKDLVRIEDFLIEHREWLDPLTHGIIRANDVIVEPTIISKPLSVGGNFKEIFAPIIFLQEYKNDIDLEYYFEDPRYAPNAMYVTLYGTSQYITELIDRPISGKILHPKSSFLHNTHLHVPGMERGTQPYGGCGYGASSISIHGETIPMATLPQRDIYERIVVPMLKKKVKKPNIKEFSEIQHKNVQKLLRLKVSDAKNKDTNDKENTIGYLDLRTIKATTNFLELNEENIYYLLREPNADYITSLEPKDIELIHELLKLLKKKSLIDIEDFKNLLYAIPKKTDLTSEENKILQSHFFQHVYHLLFGQKTGPRLAPFLYDIDETRIKTLLDI